MVVNGVPVRKDRHVEPVAAMALDILESIKELKDPTSGTPLTVTIGKWVFKFPYAIQGLVSGNQQIAK